MLLPGAQIDHENGTAVPVLGSMASIFPVGRARRSLFELFDVGTGEIEIPLCAAKRLEHFERNILLDLLSLRIELECGSVHSFRRPRTSPAQPPLQPCIQLHPSHQGCGEITPKFLW